MTRKVLLSFFIFGSGLLTGLAMTNSVLPFQDKSGQTSAVLSPGLLNSITDLKSELSENRKALHIVLNQIDKNKKSINIANNRDVDASGQNKFREEVLVLLKDELQEFFSALETGDLDLINARLNGEADVLSEESIQAFESAKQIVDAAIAVGKWTTEDVRQLQKSMPYLVKDQAEEVLSTLIPAINEGQIDVELEEGSPLLF